MKRNRRVTSHARIGKSAKKLKKLRVLQLKVLRKITNLIHDGHLAHAEAELDVPFGEADVEVAAQEVNAIPKAVTLSAFVIEQSVKDSIKLDGIRFEDSINFVGPEYIIAKILPRLERVFADC